MAAARLALRPRGTYSDPSLSRCSDDDEAYGPTSSSSNSGWNSSSVASDDDDSSLLTSVFLAVRPFVLRDKPFLPGTKSSSLSDLPRFFCNLQQTRQFRSTFSTLQSLLQTSSRYTYAIRQTNDCNEGNIRYDMKLKVLGN